MARSARIETAAELMADKMVHIVGLAAAGLGASVLTVLSALGRGVGDLVSAAVYSIGLLTMLGCSAAYNMGRRGRHRDLLRRFDHAALTA